MTCNQQNGTRLFAINPAWQCALGSDGVPFGLGSPDSEAYKFCTNPANYEAIAASKCTRKGFRGGRPLNFKYSTESNGDWKNTRCSCLGCMPKEKPCNYMESNNCVSNTTNSCFSLTNSNCDRLLNVGKTARAGVM